MHRCGQGFGGINCFNALMNLPPPFTSNNYNNFFFKLKKSVKFVPTQTMNDATQELKELPKNPPQNSFYDVPVSCDGTWQRQEFSLLNGTVSCISTDTGKILDVVPMSRYCKKCESIYKMTDSFEKTNLDINHHCSANFTGSAPNWKQKAQKLFLQDPQSHK